MTSAKFVCVASLGMTLAACGPDALPEEKGYGPNPELPAPKSEWFPTMKVATAVGWKEGEKPTPAAGFAVDAFASGFDHPRSLYELPNGDILVVETNAPPKPEDKSEGIRGFVQGLVMKKAGARTPSANRITLLRDADGDGTPETRTVFLKDLMSPFGMALIGDQFYVANADALVKFTYTEGATEITTPATKVGDLPAGRNHHWTKTLAASPDGSKLYVSVGSNSNVGENGMQEETERAAILEFDVASGQHRVFASGVRNGVGLDFNPVTKQLWVATNERDEIGPDLVPDYMTSVQDGGFYGWPYSYYGQHVDERIQPQNPELVAKAIKPDYALGAHTASLGFTFVDDASMGPEFQGGAFIGQHGSWNRNPPAGYRVIFVGFQDGKPVGMPKEILTGFLDRDKAETKGRPVGVHVDRKGALLVADDVGNVVWRVTKTR